MIYRGRIRNGVVVYVLIGLGNFLARRGDRAAFVELVNCLRSNPRTTIVPCDRDLFQQAFELFAARPDKD